MNCCGCFSAISRRSKVPLKRYNLLTTDIWAPPKVIAEEVQNGVLSKGMMRRIGNLAEYAEKNPHRIPKIARRLERRARKELGAQRYGYVHVAAWGYIEVTKASSQHLHLYARHIFDFATLLFKHRLQEMNVLGARLMQGYFALEGDTTFMREMEGYVPLIQQVAKNISPATGGGDEDAKQLRYRTTVLESLREFVGLLGRTQYISSKSLDLVYEVALMQSSATTSNSERDSISLNEVSLAMSEKKSVELQPIQSQDSVDKLARSLVADIAKLAKDAATARIVVEPFVRFCDANQWWLSKEKLVFVYLDILHTALLGTQQHYVLISTLVRHLRTPTVMGSTQISIAILKMTTQLAKLEEVEARSPSAVQAIYTLGKVCPTDSPSAETRELKEAVRACVEAIALQVGDAAQLVEVIAGVLEATVGDDTRQHLLNTIYCLVEVAKVGASHNTIGGVGFAHCFSQNLVLNMTPLLMDTEEAVLLQAHKLLLTLLHPTSQLRSNTMAKQTPGRERRPSAQSAASSSRFSDSQGELLVGTIWMCIKSGRNLTKAALETLAQTFMLVLEHCDPQGDVLTHVVPLIVKIVEHIDGLDENTADMSNMVSEMLTAIGTVYGVPDLVNTVVPDPDGSEALVKNVVTLLSRVPALATAHGGAKVFRADLTKEYSEPILLSSSYLRPSSRGQGLSGDGLNGSSSTIVQRAITSSRSKELLDGERSPLSPRRVQGLITVPSAKEVLRVQSAVSEASTTTSTVAATAAPSFAACIAQSTPQTPILPPSNDAEGPSDSSTLSVSDLANAKICPNGDLHKLQRVEQEPQLIYAPPVSGIDTFMQEIKCF